MLTARRCGAWAAIVLALCTCPDVRAQQPSLQELNRQIQGLERQGRQDEAIPLAHRAFELAVQQAGAESVAAAFFSHGLGLLYESTGNYKEAETWAEKAYILGKTLRGARHPDTVASYALLGGIYRSQARYGDAEKVLLETLAARQAESPSDPATIGRAQSEVGELYYIWNKWDKVGPYYLAALNSLALAYGPDSRQAAVVYNDLALLYRETHKLADAERTFNKALAIYRAQPDSRPEAIATTLDNVATLRQELADYGEAEKLFKEALKLREDTLGAMHSDVAESLNNLAVLYLRQGRYGDAGPLLDRALAIKEKVFGPEHPAVARILNNQAHVASEGGRSSEAASIYSRSIDIGEKAFGKDNAELELPLANLGVIEYERENYAEAEKLLRRALEISAKTLGEDDPATAHTAINLAAILGDTGKNAEAEKQLLRGRQILEARLGRSHPDLAASLHGLGLLYSRQGKYRDAESVYLRALSINTAAYGSEHPLVGLDESSLANLKLAQGRPDLAIPHFRKSLANLAHQFQEHFSYMSERDRLTFLSTAEDRFGAFLSFCFDQVRTTPALTEDMYDLVLWQKGIVATSVTSLRAAIAASSDAKSLTLLDALATKKGELADLMASGGSASPADRVQTLEREINAKEQELTRASPIAARRQRIQTSTWRDVQRALKPDEAAVEFVRLRYRRLQKWTDDAYYVALVVTPTSRRPEMRVLGKDKDIKGPPLMDYLKRARLERDPTAADAPGFYDTFWKPLVPVLGSAKRIYISPDGVLNGVSWSLAPGAGDRLAKEYSLRIVLGTRELLGESVNYGARSAVLMADPAFTSTAAVAGAPPRALPETRTEITEIERLLKADNWTVDSYVGAAASEEVVKAVKAPRILHLATHGFFSNPDPAANGAQPVTRGEQLRDAMLRSGVYLAGSGQVTSSPGSKRENGVLSAYEASELNLHGTELVVLSACDTGLGQIAAGEGVFGLQRAFREAGAEAVIMSMWPVPDDTTRELMIEFYGRWLRGAEKHTAFDDAQETIAKRLKEQFGRDLPERWGAFVLVGR